MLEDVWQTVAMHLVPAERAHRRIIDGDKVCEAIESLGDPATVRAWARRFAVVGDPTRLRLLVCIDAAGPISVSDLAAALDLNEDTVSQTLRFLRANESVVGERYGRVIRYRLADLAIQQLVELVRTNAT
jgi:DNA-binding transcriptional ArsR family regulator